MQVTRENFVEVLPLVRESIQMADFISFDAEFTGIKTSMNSEQKDFDSPEDRYQKIKGVVQSYTAIQFGICAFTWDAKAKEYKARPFNFYTFPNSKIQDSFHKGSVSKPLFL